jgi:hypothetical protein
MMNDFNWIPVKPMIVKRLHLKMDSAAIMFFSNLGSGTVPDPVPDPISLVFAHPLLALVSTALLLMRAAADPAAVFAALRWHKTAAHPDH